MGESPQQTDEVQVQRQLERQLGWAPGASGPGRSPTSWTIAGLALLLAGHGVIVLTVAYGLEAARDEWLIHPGWVLIGSWLVGLVGGGVLALARDRNVLIGTLAGMLPVLGLIILMLYLAPTFADPLRGRGATERDPRIPDHAEQLSSPHTATARMLASHLWLILFATAATIAWLALTLGVDDLGDIHLGALAEVVLPLLIMVGYGLALRQQLSELVDIWIMGDQLYILTADGHLEIVSTRSLKKVSKPLGNKHVLKLEIASSPILREVHMLKPQAYSKKDPDVRKRLEALIDEGAEVRAA